MRPMTIEGRRIPCRLCGKNYARKIHMSLPLCKTCSHVIAIGYTARLKEEQLEREIAYAIMAKYPGEERNDH